MIPWRVWMMLGTILVLSGCHEAKSTANIPAVKPFEIARYLGTWHEVARLPQWFERDMDFVTAEYYRSPNGVIKVRNRGFRGNEEKISDGFIRQDASASGSGELQVSFFRPFYSDYRIIALKEDYSAALVAGPDKDSAWILVRDPAIKEKILPEYLEILKRYGFPVEKMEYPNVKTPTPFQKSVP